MPMPPWKTVLPSAKNSKVRNIGEADAWSDVVLVFLDLDVGVDRCEGVVDVDGGVGRASSSGLVR